MTQKLFLALIVLLGFAAAAVAQQETTVRVAQAPKSLTREHELLARTFDLEKTNAELRARVADLEARLDSLRLSAAAPALQTQRHQLEAFIRATVGAPEDAPVDWSTSPPTVRWVPKPKGEDQR